MDDIHIKHIINKQYRELKKKIKRIDEDFDVEAIHHFRVAYKKLRAFLRMISREHHMHGDIKISKELKMIYKIMGSIRDFQLQQLRIIEATKLDTQKPQAYIRLLRKEIHKLKPELSNLLLENPVAESKKKTDAAMPGKLQLNDCRNFVQQKWNTVYGIILSRHFSDDNIHTIRKTLKDLFYNLIIYNEAKHDKFTLSVWSGNDEAYYHKLLDELGIFQDKCTSIALLKSYWLNSLKTNERETLNRIKEGWIKDKFSMKRLILKKLKEDIITQQAEQQISSFTN